MTANDMAEKQCIEQGRIQKLSKSAIISFGRDRPRCKVYGAFTNETTTKTTTPKVIIPLPFGRLLAAVLFINVKFPNLQRLRA